MSVLFIILSLYHGSYILAGFDMGALSEDDVMAMQQALQNEIDNMSPAERENFYQIMENVERMSQEDPAMLEKFITGQMSKDEEAQFVNAMVPEAMTQKVPLDEPKESVATTEKETVKSVETKEFTQIELSMQEVIASIIAKTESFLVKMQSYPEINSKIKNWSKNDHLTFLSGTNKQWKDIEFDINLFIQKLLIIEHEKNSVKKKAFLEAIVGDSALSSSLSALNQILTNNEKAVDIVPFGVVKIKKETKEAIQKIINTFANELYSNQANSAIDNVLKVYEAEDKKLKEEDAEYSKKALQESGKARPKEYMKSAGQEKDRSSRSSGSYSSKYDDYDYDDYGSSYSSYPSGSQRSSYSPSSYGSSSSYSPSTDYNYAKGNASDKNADFSSPESHTGYTPTAKKDLTKKPSPSKSVAPDKSSKRETLPVSKRRDEKERALNTIENYFEKVIKIFTKEDDSKELNEIFNDLAVTLKKEFTLEELNRINEKLSYIVRYLTGSKSVSDTLKSLSIKLSKESSEVKTDYKKRIEEIYKEYKDVLEKFLTQMQIMENNWDTLKASVSKNNMHYLWDSSVEIEDTSVENVDKKGKPLPTSIIGAKENLFEEVGLPVPDEKPKPTTFNDVKEAIKELDDEVKKFIK